MGFICHDCKKVLRDIGLNELLTDLSNVLSKKWIGLPDDPRTPAGILSNLGHNLFLTKGLKSTKYERFLSLVRAEGTKQVLNISGLIIIALLLIWLGLK